MLVSPNTCQNYCTFFAESSLTDALVGNILISTLAE